MTQVIDADGGGEYEYDALDQLTKVTDLRNLVTSYTLDGLGNQSTREPSIQVRRVFRRMTRREPKDRNRCAEQDGQLHLDALNRARHGRH
jgi:YD repeat-containing protein